MGERSTEGALLVLEKERWLEEGNGISPRTKMDPQKLVLCEHTQTEHAAYLKLPHLKWPFIFSRRTHNNSILE